MKVAFLATFIILKIGLMAKGSAAKASSKSGSFKKRDKIK